jgi:FkbM family methyltransferase
MKKIKLAAQSIKSRGIFRTFAYALPLYVLNNRLLSAKAKAIREIRHLTADDFVVKDILSNKMRLPLNDTGLPRDLIIDGAREHLATERMISEIKTGDVVVDIGANIGYYALLEAKIVGLNGIVYAIEPVLENVRLLENNIRLNHYNNIKVFQLAIGDKIKPTNIFIAEQCNLSSVNYVKGKPVKRVDKVNMTTLEELLCDEPYPNMIRMDVEGFEKEIIDGMGEILETDLPLKMFIEVHFHLLGKEKAVAMLTKLKKYRFEIADVIIEKKGTHFKKLMKAIYFFQRKLTGAPTAFGHLDLSIDQIIENQQILSGKWGGGLTILFERK